jgi:DNA-directed RNA polymerase subunit L
VLRYSFGIINCINEEIQKIDKKTRKMLTMYKMHHPKADTGRLYVKRKEGGRGLLQIEAAYKAEIINNAEYLNTNYKKDQSVNIAKSQESTQPNMNSIITRAAKITEELSQPNETSDAKPDGIQHTKARLGEPLKKKWKKPSNAWAVH